MQFKVTNSLAPFKVWLDDDVLLGVATARDGLKLLSLHSVRLVHLPVLFFLICDLRLLDQLSDVLLGLVQSVALAFEVLIFECQLFHENGIWVLMIRELERA